jgi:hypothetical protein
MFVAYTGETLRAVCAFSVCHESKIVAAGNGNTFVKVAGGQNGYMRFPKMN